MTPLAVSDYTVVSALGHGRAPTLQALRAGRSGLRQVDFETATLGAWLGVVDGIEALDWRADLADFDCRNNRLAELGLRADAFSSSVRRAAARFGAARIGVFLRRLVRLVGPDFRRTHARLDRVAFTLGVPLLRCRHQRSIDNLPGHRDIALLLELPVKGFHDPLERAGLGQAIAKMPDGVLVRRPIPEREPQKTQPTQAIPDHELHPRIRQVVLRLQDQRLEHHHRIERRPPALGSVAVAEPLHKPTAEILEVHRLLQNLERIALLAQGLKVIAQTEQGLGIHHGSPSSRPISESP